MTTAQARAAIARMERDTAKWAATLPPREALLVTQIYHHFPGTTEEKEEQ